MKKIYYFKLIIMLIFSLFINVAYANIPTKTLSPMLKKSKPSIVAISGVKKVNNPNSNHPEENQIAYSFGSGIIVNAEQKFVLTNAHLADNLDDIKITLSDKRKYDAEIVGVDRASDLAVLKMPDAKNLTEIKFANSDKIEVGDFVIAIGNPFGLEQTVTSGIVSALSRTNIGFDGYYDLIQTDAAINMGNSGGGLLNLEGELIGVNTAIFSPPNNGGSVGLGFAIPSNMAKNILAQLAKTGHVDRGMLGVQVQYVNSNLAEAFGLQDSYGAIINDIMPNSSAEKAKLQIADVITHVNDKKVHDPAHLRTLVSLIQPGTNAKISILRNKKPLDINVNILNPRDKYTKGETIFAGLKGAWLETTTPQTADVPGVAIADLDAKSEALKSGLKVGDIIVAANKAKTPNLKSLTKATKKAEVLIMQVIRNKNNLFIAAKKVN